MSYGDCCKPWIGGINPDGRTFAQFEVPKDAEDGDVWYPAGEEVEEFEEFADAIFEEARELLLRKNHDYGSKNISLSPGGPLNGLRVRLHDKFARIDNLMAKGVEPENESLRDSWIDALNYCAIALLVLDGKWPE